LEGLKEDDQLISGPYSAISKTLKHGDLIKEVNKEELFNSKKKEN
jgi:HlyD family secretion protein